MPTVKSKPSRKSKTRSSLKVGVLIVDDEKTIRTLIGIAIDRAGELYVVAEAVDGLDALKSLDASKPDAVVQRIAIAIGLGSAANYSDPWKDPKARSKPNTELDPRLDLEPKP